MSLSSLGAACVTPVTSRGGRAVCQNARRGRQRVPYSCGSGGKQLGDFRNFSLSSVFLTTCGHERWCARRCCRRCGRRGGRKPRGTRETCRTTATPAPTDWCVSVRSGEENICPRNAMAHQSASVLIYLEVSVSFNSP